MATGGFETTRAIMAIDGRKLVPRIKAELRISGNVDDPRLALLAEEAVEDLQQFLDRTIVEIVTDTATQTTLTPKYLRYVITYVGMVYDNNEKLKPVLGWICKQVRQK